MTKYSIMVPVYNKLEYLKKYFTFIQNQSFEDYEIIVVDDCSIDGSYEYIKSLNDKRVKLYRNAKNEGLGQTRNILLSHSEGEYLIFVDPDDYIELDLLKEIDFYNKDLDVIRFQNIIEPMTIETKKREENKNKYRYGCEETEIISGEEALLKWFIGERKINTMPWSYAMKKDLYNDVLYPSTNVLEDFAITPYLIAKAKKIKAIPFVGYHYLQYDNSLTSNKNDFNYQIEKLRIFNNIIELTNYYICRTDISDDAKKIFMDDVYNRYKIRKQKVDDMYNEMGLIKK